MSDPHPTPWQGATPPTVPPPMSGMGYYPPAPSPGEEGIDLRRVLGILRRYWLLLLLVTGLSGAAGWFISGRLTPIYESAASLRINDRESGVPGLALLNELRGQGSEVNTEMEVLRSRLLAEEVAGTLHLRLTVREPRRTPRSQLIAWVRVQSGADTGRIVVNAADGQFSAEWGRHRATAAVGDTLRLPGVELVLTRIAALQPRLEFQVVSANAATRDLQEALRVSRPSREANILQLRFSHADPAIAEAVPNLLLETFLSRRVGTRRSGASSTVSFLRAQLDTLSGELRLAEDSLRVFREANDVVSLQQQAMVSVGKLAEMQAERDAIQAELTALDSVVARGTIRDSGAASARRFLAFPTLLRNNTVSTLLSSLTALETDRGRLLATRTMRDPDVIVLTEQLVGIEQQVQTLVATYADGLRQQVAALDRTLRVSGADLNTIPAKEVSLARLTRNTSVLSELSVLLQTKLKEAEIAQAVDDPSAQVVDRSIRPDRPVSPRKGLNVALAVVFGMVVGLGGVFGREMMDTRIHSREDLQQVAPVPVLGVIPHFRMERGSVGGRLRRPTAPSPAGGALASTSLVALANPNGVVLEAYRALRTNLAFALADRPPKIVVVTSPTPGDGKSTTTANLAASLAQQKLRVLVVDADMRRGALHRTLGGIRGPGLSEILTGRADAASVIQTLSFGGVGRIDLIATGTVPPNPAELLASPRLVDFIEAMEPLYDTILIDSPPLANVTDALIIAPHADGLLLVARGNKTDRAAIRFAMEQLMTVRAKVMGTILNDFDVERAAAYGGAYGYYGGAGYASITDDGRDAA